jgi:hypothetical protein
MPVIIFERESVMAPREGLADFAGADLAGRSGYDAAKFGRGMIGGEDECVGEEGVAEEHRRMRPVGMVGGGAPVPGIGPIEDVVVDKGRQVDEFNDARTAD